MTPKTNRPGLSRVDGTPLHRQLFLVLREQIARGAYPSDAALPTEEALGREFGVSRITVRRALHELEAQGFVERRQGRGTFVLASAPVIQTVPLLPVVEGLRRVASETVGEVIDVGRRTAPAPVATLLRAPLGSEAVYVLRVRRSGAVPVMVTESWIAERFKGVATPAALRRRASYEILLKAGVKFGRVIQELSAEAADPLRARLLGTNIGAPLLRIVRLVHDKTGAPVQFLTVHVSPERSRILMEITADQVDSMSAGHVVHDLSTARAPRP